MTPDRQEITAHLDLLDTDEERLLVWLDRFPCLQVRGLGRICG